MNKLTEFFGIPRWVLTDNSCNQYVRKLEDGKYECIEVRAYPDGAGIVRGVVDVTAHMSEPDDDTLKDILSAYGYSSLEDVRELYGESADQILAECLFELDEAQDVSEVECRTVQAALDKVKKTVEKETPSFSIYQIDGKMEGGASRMFISMQELKKLKLGFEKGVYKEVYSAPLTGFTTLDDIFLTFNVDLPADYRGRSLSVSDIIVLRNGKNARAFFCDSALFREVPEFLN